MEDLDIQKAIYKGVGNPILSLEEKKRQIREYLFSINQPVVSKTKEGFLAEYRDGSHKIIK